MNYPSSALTFLSRTPGLELHKEVPIVPDGHSIPVHSVSEREKQNPKDLSRSPAIVFDFK